MLATALGTAYAVLSVTPVITKIGNGARAITCPERLTSTFGHVQSENGDYANGEQVCWLIAPTEKPSEITLSFHKFDVEQYYDALFVFDGDSMADRLPDCSKLSFTPDLDHPCLLSPAVGFSGAALPKPVTAKSGAMLLVFVSDFKGVKNGFTFAWTSKSASKPVPSGFCAVGCEQSQLGNGVCNQACFNEGCNWDKADCDAKCDMADGMRSERERDFLSIVPLNIPACAEADLSPLSLSLFLSLSLSSRSRSQAAWRPRGMTGRAMRGASTRAAPSTRPTARARTSSAAHTAGRRTARRSCRIIHPTSTRAGCSSRMGVTRGAGCP